MILFQIKKYRGKMDVCLNISHTICIPAGWIEIGKLIISIITLVAAFYGLNNWSKQLKGSRRFDIQSKIYGMVNNLQSKIWSIEKVFTIPGIDEIKIRNEDPQVIINLQVDFDVITQEYEELKKIFDQEKFWVRKEFPLLEEIINNVQMYSYHLSFLYPSEKIKEIVKTIPFSDSELPQFINERRSYEKKITELVEKFNKNFK
jgi:hypothetical protein